MKKNAERFLDNEEEDNFPRPSYGKKRKKRGGKLMRKKKL